MKAKESKPKMYGIVLSFTITDEDPNTTLPQLRLEHLAYSVKQLVKEGYPDVKHTLISRQEYEP